MTGLTAWDSPSPAWKLFLAVVGAMRQLGTTRAIAAATMWGTLSPWPAGRVGHGTGRAAAA